jgi:citrate lyase subunit beta/citryl-CoA lyase
MLFVPGDSERKIEKALPLGADALIFDLEDAVMPEKRGEARALVLATLKRTKGKGGSHRWVRVNPLDSEHCLQDLAAVIPGAPDGILLPKIRNVDCVNRLGHYLDALEAREGLTPGSTAIMAVATEVPEVMFALDSLRQATKRLIGINWGGEDLSAAIGASTNKTKDGDWRDIYKLARTLCLLAARGAGIQPLDTVHTDFRDDDGLREACIEARQDGFTGKIAIHPNQVAVINASFAPSEEEVAHARRVIEAFEAAGGAGAVQLDGQMLDMPHIKQANTVLAQWQRFGGS